MMYTMSLRFEADIYCLSDKYDLTKHPNYSLTADADDENTFHMENYLKRKLKLRYNEEYTVIEA